MGQNRERVSAMSNKLSFTLHIRQDPDTGEPLPDEQVIPTTINFLTMRKEVFKMDMLASIHNRREFRKARRKYRYHKQLLTNGLPGLLQYWRDWIDDVTQTSQTESLPFLVGPQLEIWGHYSRIIRDKITGQQR